MICQVALSDWLTCLLRLQQYDFPIIVSSSIAALCQKLTPCFLLMS